tara:strand:- start:4288 stop:5592 length:1305 start_codon:yes stop_codon:yes gene_type:complete
MIKKFIICTIVVFSTFTQAQQGTSSPYSFYGIGSLKFKGTVENQGMGGISVYTDSIHINLRNPASYTGKNLSLYNNEARPVKFAIGTSFSSTNFKTSSAKDKADDSSVDYLALVMPTGKFGIGFGLIPYSSVGYKLQSRDEEGFLQYRYRGEGGINKVFLGTGYQLTKDLKIGFDFQYNFGSITNTTIAFGYNDEGDLLQFQSREVKRSDLSGFSFNFGLAFTKKISQKLEIMATATHSPQANLNSVNQSQFATITIDSQDKEYVITSSEVDLAALGLSDTNLSIPSKTSFGIGIGRPRKWFAGIDYTFLKASDFSNRFISIDNATFKDASTLSIGGFYIPKYDSFGSYWKRIVYRAGLRLEQTGLVVNNESINELGISFGVGLPVGRLFSNANVAFEIGQRGTTVSNLVQENFFKVNISLSLNDRWFEKRKFN